MGPNFLFDASASSERGRRMDVLAIEDCQWNRTCDVLPQIA